MAAKKTAKKTPEPATPPTPVAKKTAKKAVKKPATTKPAAPKVTADAIARVAYLNYRRRVEQGLPGDSDSDWVEAERQLSSGEA